ncbi:MAG: hypothetical protein AB1792_09055 [Candidatus Zixiibacteriota bacterium]
MWRRPTIVVPLIVVAALAITVGVAIWHSVAANQGHLVFSLDDPYIHLAIARNLALHGVWGINPDQFSAASSSSLYTLLLTLAFIVTGPTEIWAWVLCISGALAIALLLAVRAQRSLPNHWLAAGVALWTVVIAGLPELAFTGMEHAWHTVAVLTLVAMTERLLAGQEHRTRDAAALVVLVLVGCALRYETLFLIPPLLICLLAAGKKRMAAAVAIAAALPAATLGIVQLAHGEPFLPNTILLKGVYYEHLGLWSYPARFLRQIDSLYWITLLGLASVAAFDSLRQRGARDPRLAGIAMFFAAVLCQSAFGLIERRYVVYVVAMGVWVVLPHIGEWIERARPWMVKATVRYSVWGMAFCVGVFPFADRLQELGRLPQLSQDIYQQQYQMARFFAENHRGRTVAVNDIGLVSWAGNVQVFDLWGLGNSTVARLRADNTFTPERMRELVAQAGAPIAAVYPGWFVTHGGLPDEWRPVGHWQLAPKSKTSVGSPLVFFFATTPDWIEPLQKSLDRFTPQLPPEVRTVF